MKEYDSLTPEMREWIARQHLFWVATAPPTPDGHVNVSPKGLDGTFKFISENAAKIASKGLFSGPAMAYFAYLDVGGSGIETHAHLHASQSKSITVLFNAYEGPPKIIRLFGRGVSIEPGETGWNEVLYEFDNAILEAYLAKGDTPPATTIRNIVIVQVQRVRDSCGFGIPFYKYESDRPIYPARCRTVDNEKRIQRRIETNALSMDGLVGLRWTQDAKQAETAKIEKENVLEKISGNLEKVTAMDEKKVKEFDFKLFANNSAWFVAGVGITLALLQIKK
eukprot:Phypoly_transcript_15367.p1 GENE.Phypoly_transcript_15367~~Phypoly_transcript_15367.p1  ORF type:complete len:280 (+),score=48.80 Phypoly_transcript_15367:61-900(+)